MSKVSAELAGIVGGSAAASANTAAGQYQRFQVALDETKEGIGAALLPMLSGLISSMTGVSKWAANNTGTLTTLIGVFSALAAIVITVNAVTKAWTAIMAVVRTATVAWRVAQFALNVALAANPIGLVVIAITLLVAAIVLAYRNSETFRNIVNAAFRGILAVVQAVVGWIRENLGPAFDRAADIAGAAFRVLGDIIKAVAGGIRLYVSGILSIIEAIISAVQRAISAIKSIPRPNLPDLNPFSSPSPAIVAGASATMRGVSRAPATGRGTSTGGGLTIVVQGALDPEGVARQIRRILGAHDVRVGRAAVVAR
jgi:phage-related protein